ncbi:MAG: hypothetical protein LUE29_03795, partial [Lachnospiraceae bacterium]|nr:hypothetical protein [Lachnospiraceae bacterium]
CVPFFYSRPKSPTLRKILQAMGGHFRFLSRISLPMEYPILMQSRINLSIARISDILIGKALLSSDSLAGFYVNEGFSALGRGLTAGHLGSAGQILSPFN